MPNRNGRAYGLTTFCPLRAAIHSDQSHAALLEDLLQGKPADASGPMARVPNTYLCRFFVLRNVIYEGKPAHSDRLASSYLAFIAEIHGDLDAYLAGMWQHAEAFIREVWANCVGFEQVRDAASFTAYLKRCQVETTFYFNGSNDAPLAEQLKALYLKQELTDFAYENQGVPAAQLQQNFARFVERVRPRDLDGPTWRPGATSTANAVVEKR